MKKTKLLLIIILLTTGCSYRELNKLAITSALGIDHIDNEYTITIQVLDLKKEGESNESEKSVIYQATGPNIPSAVRNLSLSYPKEVYLGHLKVVILGKSTKNEDIKLLFDYFLRSPETRNDFEVLFAPNSDAKEILNKEENNEESFSTEEIINSLENSMNRQGTTAKINMEELVSTYLKKGIDPVLTTIEKGDKINNYQLNGLAAFSSNSNKYFKLSKEESIAYNMINQNFYDIVIPTEYRNQKLNLLLLNPKSEIKMEIKNNKIKVDINIETATQIAESNNKINFENSKVQKEVKEVLDKKLKSYIESLLNKCKENNIDVIGLKNTIYKKYYKLYNTYKDSNIYEIADINININSKVYRYGSIYRSTKGD